jgi:hypothetical protein
MDRLVEDRYRNLIVAGVETLLAANRLLHWPKFIIPRSRYVKNINESVALSLRIVP